jgi:hypothetical protein
MRRLAALWRGEVGLAEAVWQYAVFWGLVVNILTSALFWVLALNQAHAALLIPAYLLPLPYNLLVVVAVWRSAGRYAGPRHLAELARWGTLAGMLLLSAT